MDRIWIILGSLAGLSGVALAALAAHAFAGQAPPVKDMVQQAIQMQTIHALALLFTGLWSPRGGRLAVLAGAAFTFGILLFCGDIYALAFGGLHLHIAPIGGTALMLGWALLGISALRRGA